MSISAVRAEGLRSWYRELERYNSPEKVKEIINSYLGKDKVSSLGDIDSLKRAMILDGKTVLTV